MKNISEVLSGIDLSKGDKSYCPLGHDIDEDTARIVNKLFVTLRIMFPAFRSAWSTPKDFELAKIEWIKTFTLAKMNNLNLVRFGLNKYRLLGKPFVPTSGEFIAMCTPKPEDLGLPSVHSAFKEASRQFTDGQWSHDVVYHAWSESDPHFMKNNAANITFPVFERNYEIACTMFLSGKGLKTINKAIKSPENTVITNKDIGSSALKSLKAMLK